MQTEIRPNIPVQYPSEGGLYRRYIKRPMDFILSLCAIIVLLPVLLIVAVLIRVKLGSPVIFKQKRPGLGEKIFTMYKFRTMTDERDESGELLPDSVRLNKFGCILRSTSFDELPELFNIIKGNMSVVGPRPQLVKDMVFMTHEQRQRHNVLPGLSGLAQVNGRNCILWEDKIKYDLQYIENITFFGDWKIIFQTIVNVFKRDGISSEGMATGEDFGDYLLREQKISEDEYCVAIETSRQIGMIDLMLSLKKRGYGGDINLMYIEKTNNVESSHIKFSVSMCVYKNDNPNHFNEALISITEQTVMPNEVVLVVDGPIPESLNEVIKIYDSKSFFKVIRLKENMGHGNARRIGLENCSYDLIALMDADDISVSDRFEKQIRCFEMDESLSIVGGNINEFINSIDNSVGVREVPTDDSAVKEYLKKRCPFNQVTVMFKKSDAEVCGGYIDWYYEEDYYLWIRMFLNKMKFKNIPENLVFVRVGDEMYQRRGGWKYFKSEAKLQNYMFNKEIINFLTYTNNVLIRFMLQVLMPNRLRGFIFKKFARKKVK